MKIATKLQWCFALTPLVLALYPPEALALLPPIHRDNISDPVIKIVLTLHIFGIIFWIGGLGIRLFLLGSVDTGTSEVVRQQFFATQQRIFRQIEVPAFIIALIAGIFLVYSGMNYYQRPWFLVKMLFVAGAIILDVVASRRFETVREAGKEGQAMGLGLILAVAAIIMLLGSNL
jgi:Predicted membrane protein